MNKLEIKYMDIEKLIPYVNNPRENKNAVDKVAGSIKEFGFKNPVIVDNDMVIVAGHTRLLAARKLGLTEVPVIRVEDLTPAQIKAFRIADNKVSEFSDWNEEMLAVEFEELQAAGYDVALTGFDLVDIDTLNGDNKEAAEDDYEVEPPENPISKQGDIWLLGKHRVLCEDSTEAKQVTRLMDGKMCDLVITDPPYNVDYEGGTGLKIKNDNMKEDAFYKFLYKVHVNLFNILNKGSPIYVFHADTEGANFRKAFVDSGLKLAQCLIWVKNSMVLGRQDYQWKHEPILYGWKPEAAHKWYGAYDKTTVIEDRVNVNSLTKDEMKAMLNEFMADTEPTTIIHEDKPHKNGEHPTMKPLKLIARLMKNSSRPKDLVVDLFGGSGSTLIAADQIDRVCDMMEFDEKYVDVIVNRYISYKKSSEGVILLRDGEKIPYSEVTKNDK